MSTFTEKSQIQISIIIVNYNVRDYLAQCILSVKRALRPFSYEIIVVDNASVDGSVAYLQNQFPDIKLIENRENLGFGQANNQALKIARGEFVVLVNPDTVVQEDTFIKLLDFFRETPEASAATCKIINPDGTFSVDCRHSIPTPSIAFWKVTGLSRIFPKSRRFGRYNLTYLDPDETYTVPAISGSFMMIKHKILQEVGFFDEQFFMYCEDIDLCHRINQAGYQIYYVPTTRIIHYKGESTRKDNLDYVISFNRSLYLFFKKYYAPSSLLLFRWLVRIGIFLRGIFIFLKNFFSTHFPLLLDMLILNMAILLSFVVRLELKQGFYWRDYFNQFWVINLIGSLLFLLISFYLDIYPRHRFSIQSILKANLLTFVALAFLTFFLKQFAFSRMVVLFTFILSPLIMFVWRVLLRRYYRGDRRALGRDLFSKPTVLVGRGEEAKQLFRELKLKTDIDYKLLGWVSIEPDVSTDSTYLGSLKDIEQIIKLYRIRQVIFSTAFISYETILKTMARFNKPTVEFKMFPSNLEVIIGKSHIEKLEDYPLLDIEYPIGRKFNRIIKRIFDLGFSLPLLILTSPLFLPHLAINSGQIRREEIEQPTGKSFHIFRFRNRSISFWANRWFQLLAVVAGWMSLVGSPLRLEESNNRKFPVWYKPGITGLVQINTRHIGQTEDEEKYHLYYLKNQSLFLDLEVLIKGLWQGLLS